METLNNYPVFMIIAACEQIEEWAKMKIYQYSYIECYEILRFIEKIVFEVIKCHKDYDKLMLACKDKVCCLQMRLKELISLLEQVNEKIVFYPGNLPFYPGKEPTAMIEKFIKIAPAYPDEEAYITRCRDRLCIDHDLVTNVLNGKILATEPYQRENEPEKDFIVASSPFKNPPSQPKKNKFEGLFRPIQRRSLGNQIRPVPIVYPLSKDAKKKIRNPVLQMISECSTEKSSKAKINLEEKNVCHFTTESLPEPASLLESDDFLSSTLVSSKNVTQKDACSIVTAQSILENQPLRRIRSSFRKVLTFGRVTDPIVSLNNDPYLRTVPISDINFHEFNRRSRTLENIVVPKGIISDFHELNKEVKYIGIMCFNSKKKNKITISHCIIPDLKDALSSDWNQTRELLKKTIIELKLAQIGFIVKTEVMRDQITNIMEKLKEGQTIVPEYFLGVIGEHSSEFYFCRFYQRYFMTKYPIKMSEGFLQMSDNVTVSKKKSYCIYRLDALNSSVN